MNYRNSMSNRPTFLVFDTDTDYNGNNNNNNNEIDKNDKELNIYEKTIASPNHSYEYKNISRDNQKKRKVVEIENTFLSSPKKTSRNVKFIFEGMYDGNFNGKGTMISEKTTYVGEFKNNKPHGLGEKKWFDETSFIGEFKEGKICGKGKKTWLNGQTLEGVFEGIKICEGTKILIDKTKFVGKFEGCKFKGEKILPDGTLFKGNFENDKLEGEGKITWCKDGKISEIFEGIFKEDELCKGKIFQFCEIQNKKGGDKVNSSLIKEYIGDFEKGNLTKGTICLNSESGITTINGKFINNILNGEGEKIYPDGCVYKGKFENGELISGSIVKGLNKSWGVFKNNKLNGEGNSVSNGHEFVGTFKDGLLIEGTITWSSKKDKVTGKFNGKDHKLQGQGTKIQNGNNYEGIFKDGLLIEGTIIYSSGDKKIGKFDGNEIIEGTTIIRGITCKGKFRNNKLNDSDGEKIDHKNQIKTTSKGNFIDGVLDGKGIKTVVKGNEEEVQEGNFKEGKLYKGSIKKFDGTTCTGTFEDDKLSGENGKKTEPDGTVSKGAFKNGQLNGQGIKTDPDGTVYEGIFKNGQLNGQGIKTEPDGTVYEGIFKNGQLNGKGTKTEKNKVSEGVFQNGVLHGSNGKVTFTNGITNGKVMEGEFKNGLLFGEGKITQLGKNVEEGFFKDGHLTQLSTQSQIPFLTQNPYLTQNFSGDYTNEIEN